MESPERGAQIGLTMLPITLLLLTIASQNPEITVHVYDYSGLAPAAMAEALSAAEMPLRLAGIHVSWQMFRPGETLGAATGNATHLVLSILKEQMSAKIAAGPKQMGLSIVGSGGLPRHAYVFSGRIANFAREHFAPAPLILGSVIGHELGHLLLGTGSHFSIGIMRPSWQPDDVKRALMGTLAFTRQQANTMQVNARRRAEVTE